MPLILNPKTYSKSPVLCKKIIWLTKKTAVLIFWKHICQLAGSKSWSKLLAQPNMFSQIPMNFSFSDQHPGTRWHDSLGTPSSMLLLTMPQSCKQPSAQVICAGRLRKLCCFYKKLLFIWKSYRDEQKHPPFTGLLPKWPQWPGESQAEATSFVQVAHMAAGPTFCCKGNEAADTQTCAHAGCCYCSG